MSRSSRLRITVGASVFGLLLPWWQPAGLSTAAMAGTHSTSTGTLDGIVRIKGPTIPGPTPVQNTTDPAVCGLRQSLQDLMVSARTRGVQHVIVALTDVPAAGIPGAAPSRLVLDNVRCQFAPHASVLNVGSVIEATNSDPILHTTHLYGASEANIPLPLKDMKVAYTVRKPGMIVVKCDLHGWMQAFVRVDDHPFHAVTDASGRFRIGEVPSGRYVLEAWHEKLGIQRQTVQILAGSTTSLAIEYTYGGK